ncbi:recombinase family protein [Exiguobacterium profundum]|uniref:Recombinase family protein n=1 Tax=Exiguobacterium profundum TaxID=307643 RepID=A0ABY8AYM5_9BACL|nr:recombinase family protein [Exiguobacterium profundum]WED54771.1 recombinase family protein [Exiguobacterium profundum]
MTNVCGIYVRKSRQQENMTVQETLESQRESLKAFAVGKGYAIYNVYEEVGSSVDDEREQFNSIKEDIKAGKIQIVVVSAIDRIARSLAIFEDFLQVCKDHNVTIDTPTGLTDASNTGSELLALIQSVLGKAEYSQTKRRLATGKVQAVSVKKRWIGTTAPYGYIYDKNDKELKPHPEQSKVFRKMVELSLEGNSYSQVANALNDAGNRTQNNLRWTAGRIQKILANNTYLGYAEYNSTTIGERGFATDCHEALMTEDEQRQIFALSATRRNYESHASRSWGKVKTSLDGLVYCGKCKRGMSIQISKKKSKARGEWSFYQARRCIHYNEDGTRCTNSGSKIEIIEAVVMEALEGYREQLEAKLEQLSSQDTTVAEKELQSSIELVEEGIRKQNTKLKRAKMLFLDEDVTQEEYREMKKEIADTKTSLEQERNYLSNKLKSLNVEEVATSYKNTIDSIVGLQDAPIEEQNKLMRLLVKRIELTKDSQYTEPQITIEFN